MYFLPSCQHQNSQVVEDVGKANHAEPWMHVYQGPTVAVSWGYTCQREQLTIHDHTLCCARHVWCRYVKWHNVTNCFTTPLILHTLYVHQTLSAQVLLSIMPSKMKKPNLIAGQKLFSQGSETSTALICHRNRQYNIHWPYLIDRMCSELVHT